MRPTRCRVQLLAPLRLLFSDEKFFRRNRLAMLAWSIKVVGVVLAIAVGTSIFLDSRRAQAEDAALAEAAGIAQGYARHLFRSLEAVDQLTLLVKQGWEMSGGAFSLKNLSPPQRLLKDAGFFVSVIDANGELVTSTIPDPRQVNVSEQPYFAAQRQRAEDFLYIGTAHPGRFTGGPVVPFTRKATNADGEFQGIVLVSVSPVYFFPDARLRRPGAGRARPAPRTRPLLRAATGCARNRRPRLPRSRADLVHRFLRDRSAVVAQIAAGKGPGHLPGRLDRHQHLSEGRQ